MRARRRAQTDVDGRLGITKKAHKKKLWNAIKKLKYAQADKEAKKAEKKGGKKVRAASVRRAAFTLHSGTAERHRRGCLPTASAISNGIKFK